MKISFGFAIATSIVAALLRVTSASAGEAEAVELSRNLQQYHLPSGIVADTLMSTPTSKEPIGYDDVGDSALWTGFYLASEAFRYSVTHDPEALEFAKRTLGGIQKLVDAPGDGLLARSIFKLSDPFVDRYVKIEGGDGLQKVTLDGEEYYWQMGISRDQYCGVYFGLSIAYDYIDDPAVKEQAADLITRLTDYLMKHHWTPRNPKGGTANSGKYPTTFLHLPHYRLAILQMARHVNSKFEKNYRSMRRHESWLLKLDPWLESHGKYNGYYKFNLQNCYFYNLIRLEEKDSKYLPKYKSAYMIIRNALKDHQNPHFNLVDLEINGPDEARDEETRQLLETRLGMGFRYRGIDLREKYPSCNHPEEACTPVPTSERAVEGFMWQRTPLDLFVEVDPRDEAAGLDYLLPYWMARAYGLY